MHTIHIPAAVTAVNIEAADPQSLATFWAAATGGTTHPSGEQVYLRPAEPGGVGIYLHPMTGPRPSRNLTHVDLTVAWGSRGKLVERLLARGALHCWDVLDEHPSVQWTTLADPEGNLFCVAEHPPTHLRGGWVSPKR